MAVRGETSWRPRRQCPPLRHQRPACVSGSPESEARGLRGQGGAGSREDSPPLRPPEAQGPVGALFNTTLFQYKQSRKKSRPFRGGMLGTVVCGARKSSPCHRWGAQAAGSRGRWHQGWHSAWPAAETCRSVGAASSPWGCCPGSQGQNGAKESRFRPACLLLPRPALCSQHPGRSPGQSRPTTATKQGKKGQSLQGTAVHHGWHGRTRTHPGGVLLRAIATERVSETGGGHLGL